VTVPLEVYAGQQVKRSLCFVSWQLPAADKTAQGGRAFQIDGVRRGQSLARDCGADTLGDVI
jgi:hypothetical protein